MLHDCAHELITCEYNGPEFSEPRSHPWTSAEADPTCRYYDFKAEKGRIRDALEDFVPWNRYAAIDDFYSLIEWLNGADCIFESNDCEFTGSHSNDAPAFKKSRQCSGRLMVLYRALDRNLNPRAIGTLKNDLHVRLQAHDRSFQWGMLGTTVVPVRYHTIDASTEAQLGQQLMISFWAWGDTDAELMKNFRRVIRNLSAAFHSVADASDVNNEFRAMTTRPS